MQFSIPFPSYGVENTYRDIGLSPLLFSLPPLLVDELEVLLAENKGVSEVLFAYDFVFGQFFGTSLEEDSTFKEQVGAVGNG